MMMLQVEQKAVLQHDSHVRQVEWNAMGTWLAVATEEGGVSLWRPDLGGDWSCQSRVESQDQDADYIMINK